MLLIAILLCGYSVFTAFGLILTHFKNSFYAQHKKAQLIGILLLLVLASLQFVNFLYLQASSNLVHSLFYQSLLFLVAPLFYLYSCAFLNSEHKYSIWHWLHLLPFIFSLLLPQKNAFVTAFALGAVYMFGLGLLVYRLRAQRNRFQFELILLMVFVCIAIGVVIIGISSSFINDELFFILYSIAIGCAFLLSNIALLQEPQLVNNVHTAAEENYVSSTLKLVNVGEKLKKLNQLMDEDKIYQQTDLNLIFVAQQMGLSKHQLSELINTQLGMGFSQYIRSLRIRAAQTMLINEPKASVLSISLAVGLTSQSNFYQAFKELTGLSPGQYRDKKTKN